MLPIGGMETGAADVLGAVVGGLIPPGSGFIAILGESIGHFQRQQPLFVAIAQRLVVGVFADPFHMPNRPKERQF